MLLRRAGPRRNRWRNAPVSRKPARSLFSLRGVWATAAAWRRSSRGRRLRGLRPGDWRLPLRCRSTHHRRCLWRWGPGGRCLRPSLASDRWRRLLPRSRRRRCAPARCRLRRHAIFLRGRATPLHCAAVEISWSRWRRSSRTWTLIGAEIRLLRCLTGRRRRLTGPLGGGRLSRRNRAPPWLLTNRRADGWSRLRCRRRRLDWGRTGGARNGAERRPWRIVAEPAVLIVAERLWRPLVACRLNLAACGHDLVRRPIAPAAA
jgi:hypothetical protein